MAKEFIRILDQDGGSIGDYLSVLNDVISASGGEDPIYIRESATGTFVFFAKSPITAQDIKEWFDELWHDTHKAEEFDSEAD